jgi:hypothetical protein
MEIVPMSNLMTKAESKTMNSLDSLLSAAQMEEIVKSAPTATPKPKQKKALTAEAVVNLQLSDKLLAPQVGAVNAGTVAFVATNTGKLAHNVVLNGKELGVVFPFQTKTFTAKLKSGANSLVTNRHPGYEKQFTLVRQ